MASNGTIGGRYRFARKLGTGGMARVYLCWDERLRLWCAVKVMTSDAVRDAVLRARFALEARTLARLGHPNLVRLFDLVDDAECPYMVMEYVEGGSLSERLTRGPIHLHHALLVSAQLCAALEAAHAAGVVHRDVKPQNVLMDRDGTVKVTDFGVARVEEERIRLTMSNMSLGTLAYMAPEQQRDASKVDHRADLYGAGATLYALVTGRRPTTLLTQDRDRVVATLPEPVRAIVRRATEVNKVDRYATAAEMEDAIREALGHVPLPPDAPPLVDRVDAPPSGPPTADLTLDPGEMRELAGTERRYSPGADDRTMPTTPPPPTPIVLVPTATRIGFQSIDPSADSQPSPALAKTVDLPPSPPRPKIGRWLVVGMVLAASFGCASCVGLGAAIGGFGYFWP